MLKNEILEKLKGLGIGDTVCFTGSRPAKLRGYKKELYTQFVDQLAFWAVDKTKSSNSVINAVYQPFIGQEKRWLAAGLFSQKDYRTMLHYADEVNVVAKDIDTADYKAVCKALDDRNRAMVDDAGLVIALYQDDTWEHAVKSGTANCMRYAKRCQKPILQLCYDTDNGFSGHDENINTPLVITNMKLWLPGEY